MQPTSLLSLDARYQRRSRIGEGGMGEVHRGWDLQLQRAVALKFIHGNDPKQAERLMLEARLQASVIHPHIAQVYETGLLEGRPCLAMQLVDGPPMDRAAQDLPLRERVRLLKQAAEAVHAAHLQGLLHCDLKPGNILVETDAEGHPLAYVTDFGLARSLDPSGHTRTQNMAGTLWFMAPELLSGTVPMDVRTDVYSLGATLYALLALHPPFADDTRPLQSEGTDATAPQRADLRRLISEDPTPLRSVNPSLPKDLERITAMAMDKDPGRRYPSALAFAEDLEAFLEGRAIRAQPETPFARALRWAKRNPIAARAIGFGALALITSALIVLWNANRTAAISARMAQLGSEAKGLETDLRMAALEPSHDLRPLLMEVRQRLDRLRAEEKGPTRGPAAYALARGHMALGEWEPALECLQRAEKAGLKAPELDGAFAEVELSLFERDSARALNEPDAARRLRKIASAREAYLIPARRHLRAGGLRSPLMDARLALAEGRSDEALAMVRAQQGSGAFEAYRLEAFIAWNRQKEQVAEGQFQQAERWALLARQALAQALRIGRSDRESHLLLARIYQSELPAYYAHQRSIASPLKAARAALEQVRALDPDWGESLLMEGWLDVEEGRHLDGDPLRAQALFRQAAASAALAQAQPGLYRPALELHVWALLNLDHALILSSSPRQTELEQAVVLGRALVQAFPASSDGHDLLSNLLLSLSDLDAGRALPLLKEAEEQARLAMSLEPHDYSPRIAYATACASLGSALAQAGEDAEPAFTRGLEALTSFHQDGARNAALQETLLFSLGSLADFLISRGRTPEPHLSRAIELGQTLAAPGSRQAYFLKQTGELYLMRATWRALVDQSPLEDVDSSVDCLLRAEPRLPGNLSLQKCLADAALQRAEWQQRKGQDPSSSVKSASQRLARIAAMHPTPSGLSAAFSRLHLLRASAPHLQKTEVERELTLGLASSAEALKEEPGSASTLLRVIDLCLLSARLEGRSLSQSPRWDQARTAHDRLKRLAPQHPALRALKAHFPPV
jgi:hypothetical protein